YVDGRDEANTSDNIYAQRIDSAGNPVWAIDGVPVCTADSIQFWPYVRGDEIGGAIVTWREDYRNSATTGADVFAQMLDSLGNTKWTTDGQAICLQTGNQSAFRPITNRIGGCIIGWYAAADPNRSYLQSVDSLGNKAWGDVPMKCLEFLCDDGKGGGIGATAAYANHIDSNGNILWGSGVQLFGDTIGDLRDMRSDGFGGALIIRDDRRNNPTFLDQYAQRVDSSGNLLWGSTGVPVCTLHVSPESYPKITSDGLGGALCAWHGQYPGSQFISYRDIIAQRVYPNGTPGGVAGGRVTQWEYLHKDIKAYPNPFSSVLTVMYALPEAGNVNVSIYNVTGQKIVAIEKGMRRPGKHTVRWNGCYENGKYVSTGIYFLRMGITNSNQTVKLIKLK
ncbi:T9SS type A sorting domain-containing protein, partial [bacterium]|nr:T9SS type A sorting domain-containing protein [bacterium]